MIEEAREKERLCRLKCRISEEGNPLPGGIDVIVVSPPSPKEKHRISIETIPIRISSRKIFF
jgi:hypothetical protein